MPMTKLRLAGLLVATVSVGPMAGADAGLPDDILDGDAVTIEEVRANSEAVFEAFAGESGGPVSRRQFTRTEIPRHILPERPDRGVLEDLFTVLDSDGDGRLTRAEWNARIERDLQMIDANGDGRITVEELANARENIGIGDAVEMLF